MEAKAKVALAQGWSSLPADLVNRVADCLLATNDLDCYVDLRAVCQHWRSSTADPRSNPHDPRFRPTHWVMLDEVKHYDCRDDDRLFVNAATGRFLRRSLPVLRDYDLVTSTTGGLLVLATTARDRDSAASTRASVRVLNPFTGSSIDFAAPMPPAPWRFTADVVGSSPTLVLFSIVFNRNICSNKVYWAEPQTASFSMERHTKCLCGASSLPLIAAAKCDAVKRCSGSKACEIFKGVSWAVRVPGGDMLAVQKRGRGVDVFKVDADGNMMRRVRSIGNLALFLGVRCVAVDVDMFKGIQANCAYFTKSHPCSNELEIYKVDIEAGAEEQEPEFVETAVTYSRPDWSFHLTPYTLTQVLCNYTMDIARHPPTWDFHRSTSFCEMGPHINS